MMLSSPLTTLTSFCGVQLMVRQHRGNLEPDRLHSHQHFHHNCPLHARSCTTGKHQPDLECHKHRHSEQWLCCLHPAQLGHTVRRNRSWRQHRLWRHFQYQWGESTVDSLVLSACLHCLTLIIIQRLSQLSRSGSCRFEAVYMLKYK